jgi:hypothetical protein
MKIKRKFDIKSLVGELGNNKVDALELLREALSNAKDHGASRFFIRVRRDPQGRISVVLVDNGEGLNEERWSAFWGAATSVKTGPSVGSKGFGTKLFFQCERLSITSRSKENDPWMLVSVDRPYQDESSEFPVIELPSENILYTALKDSSLFENPTGIAIAIEDVRFTDKDRLISRERIESYCDWFTILADVRSGLFDERSEFHRAIKSGGAAIDGLRTSEVSIKPIEILLQINGETKFTPLGINSSKNTFFSAWSDDTKQFEASPELIMFGHRFADSFIGSSSGAIKDDRTAIRLTSPDDWVDADGIAIVAHVEGHRRQRETYLEAGWQNKKGMYNFDERFGLWLCRDFIPVVQKNDLLKKAILEAQPRGLTSEFKSVRNWKIFVNDQGLIPIANRGDISNYSEREGRILQAIVSLLKQAFKRREFADWIEKLRSARRERERNTECTLMATRKEDIQEWITKKSPGGIDTTQAPLQALDPEDALLMRSPRNEQELFYLYALLSARFEVPVFILEYNATEGVDAIGRINLSAAALVPKGTTYACVEFKFEVEQGYPINHYFDAIDLIICYRVGKTGQINEEGSNGLAQLRKRVKPILASKIDTHEIIYRTTEDKERIIPVIQLLKLFQTK